MRRLAVASVIQVVDGDTFHSLLDIGWGIILRPRTKQKGGGGTVRAVFPDGTPYDAPETSTELGRRAKAYAARIIEPGQELEVVSHGIDAWGRTLGSVKLSDGQDWATTMQEAGY